MNKRNDRQRDKHILFVCLKMSCSLSMHVICSKKKKYMNNTKNSKQPSVYLNDFFKMVLKKYKHMLECQTER